MHSYHAGEQTVSQLHFCHNLKVTRSVQAKRDTASRNSLNGFPALVPSRDLQVIRVFAGETTEIVIVSIMNTIMRLLITFCKS